MKFQIDGKPATADQVVLLATARGRALQILVSKLSDYVDFAEAGELNLLAEAVIRDAAEAKFLLDNLGERTIN
jgi:N-acetylglutamate synthase/N-acetylornithine aminotransferase